jgi:hypothetical protein
MRMVSEHSLFSIRNGLLVVANNIEVLLRFKEIEYKVDVGLTSVLDEELQKSDNS